MLETNPRHHIPPSQIPTMPRAPPLCSKSVYLFQFLFCQVLVVRYLILTAACQHHSFTVALEQHVTAWGVCRAWKTHVLNTCIVSNFAVRVALQPRFQTWRSSSVWIKVMEAYVLEKKLACKEKKPRDNITLDTHTHTLHHLLSSKANL